MRLRQVKIGMRVRVIGRMRNEETGVVTGVCPPGLNRYPVAVTLDWMDQKGVGAACAFAASELEREAER
jgi:hypothetical protein